jgi:hypothetical protein
VETWRWILVAVIFALVLVFVHKMDQYERNHDRRIRRMILREQAHEDMRRINYLWPPD